MNPLSLISVLLVASAAVPIWSRALNEVDACHGKKIYIMDLGMFAAQTGAPTCDVTKVGPPDRASANRKNKLLYSVLNFCILHV
jgi:hypothetical protein